MRNWRDYEKGWFKTWTLGLIAGMLNGFTGFASEEAGVKLDNSITVNGTQLVLNGAGARASWRL